MARKRRTHAAHPGELNLTAMIDVAFQLLAFFLLAIKPVDVFANLEAFRPSPEPPRDQHATPPPLIRILLPQNAGDSGACVINDIPLTAPQVEHKLMRYGESDPSQTILIQCAKNSTHRQLVELLDKCAKARLTSISVVSSAGI